MLTKHMPCNPAWAAAFIHSYTVSCARGSCSVIREGVLIYVSRELGNTVQRTRIPYCARANLHQKLSWLIGHCTKSYEPVPPQSKHKTILRQLMLA